MDWDLAIKRNSEALTGIVEDALCHAGACRRGNGFAAAVANLPGRAARSPPRRNPPCAASLSLRHGVLW